MITFQWLDIWSLRFGTSWEPFIGNWVRKFNVIIKTFKNPIWEAVIVLLLSWRWAFIITEATPVSFTQELFSLFGLLKVMLIIIVSTILKIMGNFYLYVFLFSVWSTQCQVLTIWSGLSGLAFWAVWTLQQKCNTSFFLSFPGLVPE